MIVRAAIPADAPLIAEVHYATWLSAYRGLMPDNILTSLDLASFTARWQRQLNEGGQPVCVAGDPHPLVGPRGDAGKVVGFAHGGPERTQAYPGYDGEVNSLYILAGYQGRGLGRQLVAAIAGALAADHQGLLIWVLSNNPARRFYEAIGGTRLGEKTFELGGHTLLETAYGWPDLRTLL